MNLLTPYSSILLVNPQPIREMNCASVLCRVFLFDENQSANVARFDGWGKVAVEQVGNESKKNTLLTRRVVHAKTAIPELARPSHGPDSASWT